MNTLAKNQHHNARLVREYLNKIIFYNHLKPTQIVDYLVTMNLVTGTNVVEVAMAAQNRGVDFDLCPEGDHQDFTDGTDAKTCTVQKEMYWDKKVKDGPKKRFRYKARIKDIDKIAGLRVVVYNPFTDKQHFLFIPKSYITKRDISTVTISFDKTSQEITGEMKIFEFTRFEDICRAKHEIMEDILSRREAALEIAGNTK